MSFFFIFTMYNNTPKSLLCVKLSFCIYYALAMRAPNIEKN